MCRDAHSAGLKTELGEGEREEKGYDSMRNRPIFRKVGRRSRKKKLRIRKMDEKLVECAWFSFTRSSREFNVVTAEDESEID